MKYLLLLISCGSTVLSAQVAPPASAVFDNDTVHEIRLTFKQADWYEQLTTIYDANPDDTPYIEGSIVWGPYQFDSIGVRFKGNSSYRGATTRKKPFRIKLNEFVKGQKIEKMASFGLSNGWSDPSFVREKAYYEVAAQAGLPAARSSFAALYVNDEYMGLYILGEIVNGDFLDNHFDKEDRDGNLYKAANPGANLAYLGEDAARYQQFFSKESNEEEDDWTDLIALARILDQTPAAELPDKLNDLVDIDSFLTALALDNLTVNLDSYVGMAQNYYLYRRLSDNKWVWIPWDPSLAFGALAQGVTQQGMRDLPLEWTQAAGGGVGLPGGGGGFPFPGGGGLPPGGGGLPPGGGVFGGSATRPIATKLWEVPEYKARYREIYQRLMDQVFFPSEVVARMNTLRELIHPWVEQDTQKLVTMAQFENAMTGQEGPVASAPGAGGGRGGFGGGGAPALDPFVTARAISVAAQLAGRPSPVISAAPATLLFAQVARATGGGTSQEVAVSLPEGTPETAYTAVGSAPWISLTGGSGTLPGKIGIGVNGSSLPAGVHNGLVNISAAETTNSPLAVPVTLVVAASPAIVTAPASLTFSIAGGFGGAVPGLSQTLQVLSTAGASSFTFSITESTCGNFVSVALSGTTTPATLTVTANGAGTTGSCTARLTLASSGLEPATVPITLAPITFPGGGPGGPGGPPAPPTID
jgi:spore coat protein CotH